MILLGGSDSSEMITQEDTIFVAGMNPITTEEEINHHFCQIGLIKVKILFKKKKTIKIELQFINLTER